VQVQQLSAALAEFERLSREHSREGSMLMSRANSPGWIFAEAAEQAGKPLQQDDGSSGDTAEPAAAAAAAAAEAVRTDSSGSSSNSAAARAERRSLDQQLVRHVKSRRLHMVSLHMLMSNTRTRLQIAKFLVSAM
jgi:hypothetical protein